MNIKRQAGIHRLLTENKAYLQICSEKIMRLIVDDSNNKLESDVAGKADILIKRKKIGAREIYRIIFTE